MTSLNDRHYVDQGALQVYAVIVESKLNSGGIAPSIEEIVKGTGYHSTKPVYDRLAELQRLGLIKREKKTPRSIRVLGETWVRPDREILLNAHDLTSIEKRILRAIYSYAEKNGGTPPTLSDIAKKVGFASDSTAKYHVESLIERQYLFNAGGHHRSIGIVGGNYSIDLDKVPPLGVPVVSRVIADSMFDPTPAVTGQE